MYDAIADHKVTHLCGRPDRDGDPAQRAAAEKKPLPHVVEFFTAAAPPPEAVLAAMRRPASNVTHVYGLTETYGPASTNEWHSSWDALPLAEQGGQEGAPGRALRSARGARRASTPTPWRRWPATASAWAR